MLQTEYAPGQRRWFPVAELVLGCDRLRAAGLPRHRRWWSPVKRPSSPMRPFKELIPAIIETQGPVDAVSGATFTSRAVEEAVRDALSIKEGQ